VSDCLAIRSLTTISNKLTVTVTVTTECIFSEEQEDTLPPEIMNIVGRVEALQKYVRQADYAFYNVLVDILMPDVLRPVPS